MKNYTASAGKSQTLAEETDRIEQAYVNWIKRYTYFHNVRHPAEMGAPQVQAFLTHLAVEENVAASTQNQALSPWA